MEHPELEGKVALVTGGSRGIGAGIVRHFTKLGLKVAAAARGEAGLRQMAEECGCLPVPLDVTDRASIDAGVALIHERLGPIAVAVNGAGIATSAPVVKTTDADWDRVIATNLTGPFMVARAVIPDMVEAGWGRIINVASNAGLFGRPYIAPYTASKHGLIGLTRTLAHEVARKGITVNAVCPGFVETDILADALEGIVKSTGRSEAEARRALEDLSPQRRIYTVEEVAYLCGTLLPEAARGINGSAISLDGGQVPH